METDWPSLLRGYSESVSAQLPDLATWRSGFGAWVSTLFENPFALYGTLIIAIVFCLLFYRLILPVRVAAKSLRQANRFLNPHLASSEGKPARELIEELVAQTSKRESKRFSRLRSRLAFRLASFERDWRSNVIDAMPGYSGQFGQAIRRKAATHSGEVGRGVGAKRRWSVRH